MAGEIQLNSTTFATESGGTVTVANVDSATNRTNLGLGSMATQNANAVALTGGSLTGTGIDLKSSGTTIYASDGTTAVLSESGGLVTLTEDVQHIVPIVIAKQTGTQQSVTSVTFTKVEFNTEEVDTHNFFDPTTNYRFTPNIEGYYHITTQVGLQSVGGTRFITDLYKNNALHRRITDSGQTTNNEASYSASAIVELNGSTDYIEVFVYVVSSNSIAIESSSGQTHFNAFLIQRTS